MRNRRQQQGFTLLETLVALVMFGIITTATSIALTTALESQKASQQRHQTSATVRAIFDMLTRDLNAAYGSSNNPNTLFVSGAPTQNGQGGGSSSTQILTLSTLSQRIHADSVAMQQAGSTQTGNAQTLAPALPQSNCALVRYDFDPQSGSLYRIVNAIPSLQILEGAPLAPDAVVANNIVSITLQYWDPTQSTFRPNWDYENQAQSQSSTTSGQSGTQQGTSGTTASTPAASSNNGDTTLPLAVQVDLVLRTPDNAAAHYTTTIPLVGMLPSTSSSGTSQGGTQTGGTGGAAQGAQ